jgi:putative addiction module component (TIGR02574 family)
MNIAEWKEYVFSLLSRAQRAELALELLDSLDDEAPVRLSAEAQRTEIRRRIKAADAGEMASHPWEEVKQRLLDRNA